jgi:ATP phosphoribosyltransferase
VLNLAIPKGSLEQQTLQLFADADIPVKRRSDREYNATIDDPRIGQVKILRPQEIGRYVQLGYFDIGVTGRDWICETNADVVDVLDMAYNKQGIGRPVKLVLAVPREAGIRSPRELRDGVRVATEYLNVTKKYFETLGIVAQVMPSYGATEAKVPEIADAIVELTETGSTLARHGIEIIDTVMESTTKLVANRDSYADPVKRQEIEEIKTLLEGVLAARGKVLLKMNVRDDQLDQVIAIMPAMKAPTVSRLFNTSYYALEGVVVKAEVNLLIPELKKRGAEDILELPISKIVQ